MKKILYYPRTLRLFQAFFLLAAGSRAQAQGKEPAKEQTKDRFQYHSAVGQVGKEGFYKITLWPSILATCKEDLSDIRIADGNGKQAPYILRSDRPVFSSQNFLELPILSHPKREDSVTELVIGNPSGSLLSSLLLQVENYSAYRRAVLSGSDDRGQWYVIREAIELEEANSNNREYHVQSISFPPSRYRFFRIRIDDKDKLPIRILKAGIYMNNETNGQYLDIPDARLTRKDSADKHTYIGLHYDGSYFISRMTFRIQGPAFYKRRAWIYTGNAAGGRRVAEIELNPKDSSFGIPSVKTDQLTIEIENGDNPPLVIGHIAAAQLNQYLLTYLQPGIFYTLLTGDSAALSPDYDLKYADDSLMANAQEIHAGKPAKVVLPPTGYKSAGAFSGLWLWSVLGVILLLLAFLSYRMIQSISHKNNDRL